MKENKVLKFELSPQNLRIKNVLRNDFIAIDVYAISNIYPNRNNSHFTADSLRDAIPTFYNKPALGAFNVSKNDFKAHEMELKWDNELQQDYFDFTNGRCEVPLGVIRSEDLVEVIDLNGQTWVHFTCVLWAKYCYRQVKRLLKDQRKKISVEVEVLESHEDENGVEVIDKFTFDGFSLLGEDVTEAIPNAHLTILDKVNDVFYQKQEKCLSFAYKGLDNESYDFALNENDIKDTKDSFADDSGEIVDNEKEDEITMEHGEEESQEMNCEDQTILFNDSVDNDCEDVKETETVEETKEECSDTIQETESCENKEEESAEEKEECSDENKTCESDDADGCGECETESMKTECGLEEGCEIVLETEEEKENESVIECENCSEDEDDDSTDDAEDKDDDVEPSDLKEEECVMSVEEVHPKEAEVIVVSEEDVGIEEKNTPEVNTDILAEHDEGSIQSKTYTIGEETFTADELYEKFVTMSAEMTLLQEKYNTLNAQVVAKQNTEFYSFACSLIDEEEDLTVENNIAIKAVFAESCKNGLYTTTEQVQTAVDHSLADALYAQKKLSKAKKNAEFSVNISKSQVISNEETLTDAQILKSLNQKLRRI